MTKSFDKDPRSRLFFVTVRLNRLHPIDFRLETRSADLLARYANAL